MEVWEFIKDLMHPQSIIEFGGLILLLIVIFAENGLVIGFFLPGDSLIFLAGLICGTRPDLLGLPIAELLSWMILAAILGSTFGYYFGHRVGPRLFERKDSLIFKKKYLEMTQAFYNKHGGKTLVLGRFLPIIRTFAPILAGVIRVRFGVFLIFNIIGGILWVCSLGIIGYYLGSRYPLVEHYLKYIIIGFVGFTSVILIRAYYKQRKAKANEEGAGESEI